MRLSRLSNPLPSTPYSERRPRKFTEKEMASCRRRIMITVAIAICTCCVYLMIRSRTFQRMLYPSPAPRIPRLVLIWDRQSHFVDVKPYRETKDIPKKRLGNCFCDITSDAGAWKLADAVLIDAFYLRRLANFNHFFPVRRPTNQLWTFYMLEPAQILTENRDKDYFHHLNGQFNLTMTYRRDSDIPIGYGLIRPYFVDEDKDVSLYKNYAEGKTHLAAWFVSNCQAKSARMDYVKELQKYIPVDIFGDCGPSQCPNATTPDCSTMLNQHYKFYLSFESTVCKDYVTEKFFNPLQLNIVPVVLGGGNYTAINAPAEAYIDIRKYKTVKDLADYLLYLDSTPNAYNTYFEWKRKFNVVRKGVYSENLCNLCHKLKEIAYESLLPFRQIYPDMMNWWHEQAECKRGAVSNGTWKTL